VSDPSGSVRIHAESLTRYRFASKAADYLICGTCGVYVGAVATIGGRSYATLNLNAFDDPHPEVAASPVSYAGETAEAKEARRLERWTPAVLVSPNT
jgi:hypothetical protein